MAIFTGQTPAATYGDILTVGAGSSVGLTNVLTQITDAYGAGCPLSLSTIAFNIARSGYTFSLDSVPITAAGLDINSMCNPNPVATGFSSLTLPAGNTSNRPISSVNGMIRYNSQTNVFEGYQGGIWETFQSSSPGVTTITGAANQIVASSSVGNITLSLAPNITGVSSLTVGNIQLALNGTNQINTSNAAPVVFNVDVALEHKELIFFDSTGIGYLAFKSPSANYSHNIAYTLPIDAPSVSGYVLSSTTAGVLSWAVPTSGSVTSVSGTTNQINSTGGAAPVLTLSSTVMFPGTAAVDNGNDVIFYDSTGIGYASFAAPTATYSSNAAYQWPIAPPGVNGYVLSATTGGVMSWVANTVDSVTSVSGTTNQITASASTGAVTLSIPSNPIFPGNPSSTNFINGLTSTASGGTLTLTVSSTKYQILTGASATTIVLPDATTLKVGQTFEINNNSSGGITVQTNGGGALFTGQAGNYALIICTGVGTSAGTWDYHWLLPTTTLAGQAYLANGVGSGYRFTSCSYPFSTAQGDILISASANAITGLAKDANATRYLSNTGASNNPAWAQVALSTGISGFGTNVATFLAIPSSANLAAAITDETGSGALVFATSPTLVTPTLGAATATSITFNPTTGGIDGTPTNDNAGAGKVGEFVSSVILSASAVNVTVNTPTDITSISLTAGDWDVWGNLNAPTGVTSWAQLLAWVSSTSAAVPNAAYYGDISVAPGSLLSSSALCAPQLRFSLSGATTIYLSTYMGGAAGTGTACGGIYARRAR